LIFKCKLIQHSTTPFKAMHPVSQVFRQ